MIISLIIRLFHHFSYHKQYSINHSYNTSVHNNNTTDQYMNFFLLLFTSQFHFAILNEYFYLVYHHVRTLPRPRAKLNDWFVISAACHLSAVISAPVLQVARPRKTNLGGLRYWYPHSNCQQI